MRHRLLWTGTAAVAALLLATGVLAWQWWPRAERTGPLMLAGDDPRIYVFNGDFILQPTLGVAVLVRYDPQSRCLYADYPGDVRRVPIWPGGSRPVVEDGRRGVWVPGIGTVLDGDSITGAGVAGGPIDDPDFTGIAPALRVLGACLAGVDDFSVFYEITAVESSSR